MNLYLCVKPNKSCYNASQVDYKWKPSLFDVGPWTAKYPSLQSTIADESDVCLTIADRVNQVSCMSNGKGLLFFSYGPSQSGKTCKLVGGRMARVANIKDDCAPKQTQRSTDASHVSGMSELSDVDLEAPSYTYEELRRQYLALLGEETEEPYGEDSLLSTFLIKVTAGLQGKGTFDVSAVEYFNFEWYDLLSKELMNVQNIEDGCWKPFASVNDCVSLFVKAQNRRIEPSEPDLESSVSHLIIRIRFNPKKRSMYKESIAYFVDLAGTSCDGRGSDFEFEPQLEWSLHAFRKELLSKSSDRSKAAVAGSQRSASAHNSPHKGLRWTSFVAHIMSREVSTIVGLFTVNPSKGNNPSNFKTLHFSHELWRNLLLPASQRTQPSEKEKAIMRIYTSPTHSLHAASVRSTGADGIVPLVPQRRPVPPWNKMCHSGRFRRQPLLEPSTSSHECMKAALDCMETHRREEKSSDLHFLSLKEENCRLALGSMEREGREVLMLRRQLLLKKR